MQKVSGHGDGKEPMHVQVPAHHPELRVSTTHDMGREDTVVNQHGCSGRRPRSLHFTSTLSLLWVLYQMRDSDGHLGGLGVANQAP